MLINNVLLFMAVGLGGTVVTDGVQDWARTCLEGEKIKEIVIKAVNISAFFIIFSLARSAGFLQIAIMVF